MEDTMDRETERPQGAEDRTYEAPAIEVIGDAEELAKGNEGSGTDSGPI
jgi:hypothetical protein